MLFILLLAQPFEPVAAGGGLLGATVMKWY